MVRQGDAVAAVAGERFPQLTAAMRETAAEGGQNQAFTFGLEHILDGLAALIDRRATVVDGDRAVPRP